jgi:hypothetical protein
VPVVHRDVGLGGVPPVRRYIPTCFARALEGKNNRGRVCVCTTDLTGTAEAYTAWTDDDLMIGWLGAVSVSGPVAARGRDCRLTGLLACPNPSSRSVAVRGRRANPDRRGLVPED